MVGKFLVFLFLSLSLSLQGQAFSSSRNFTTISVLETATTHLKTLQKGDILTAYRKMTSQEFKANTSLIKFIEMVKSLPEFTTFEGICLQAISFETCAAVWEGTLHDKYGLPTLSVHYSIIIEDGHWVIQTMKAAPYAQQKTLVAEPMEQSKKQCRRPYVRNS